MATDKLVEIDHVTDYIKMANVAEEIKKICQSCRDTCAELDGLEPDCESGCGIFELKSKVAAIPAADVVEVVRCKDCKHYNPKYEFKCVLPFGLVSPDYDDFCPRGKRRPKNEL